MDSRFTSTSSSTQQSPFTSSSSAATSSSKIAPPPRQPVPKTSSTDPFLKDFTLVAEAAKRAQMAVLMRDFESVGLS
ncbi:hypothetical protein QBC40DRAFT_173249 [Triangularia verruculosa]|uniref:Uncharacterized protein n=1 Tax=Triangularia verruculosa TaxID=2587418 RepID=A0AAN6XMY9_9PEZI|nr:hypothetical protein QBC40DRAFT_173249 [Triangularia verruculosa]